MLQKTIYLAGGCYWGVQRYMDVIRGVLETEVGFANGDTEAPTYEQVKHENTGHAETVRVLYDADRLPLAILLKLFFEIIDPVAVDHQGEDFGHQYRTGIYWTDLADEAEVRHALSLLEKSVGKPLAVEACALKHFYPAEEYHQKYLVKNPSGYCHVNLEAIRRAALTEVLSLYDENGNPAGSAMIRGSETPEGLYRGVAEVVIRHRDGSLLLTRRDERKPTFPGRLEGSAGGAVQCGESFEEAARREAEEETGIVCGELKPMYNVRTGVAFHQGFLAEVDTKKDAVRLQEGETTDYRWVTPEEFLEIAPGKGYAETLWRRQEESLRAVLEGGKKEKTD